VRAPPGDTESLVGETCVVDMTDARAVVGVRKEDVGEGSGCTGADSSVSSEEDVVVEIKRAGFGKVLYVEPREVYLENQELYQSNSYKKAREKSLTLHRKGCSKELSAVARNSRPRSRTS
jgi:hypothetical protein